MEILTSVAGSCDAGGCDAGGCDAGGCDAGGCDAGGCDADTDLLLDFTLDLDPPPLDPLDTFDTLDTLEVLATSLSLSLDRPTSSSTSNVGFFLLVGP